MWNIIKCTICQFIYSNPKILLNFPSTSVFPYPSHLKPGFPIKGNSSFTKESFFSYFVISWPVVCVLYYEVHFFFFTF